MITWDLINTVLFWTGVYILSWYAYILIFHKAVPNIKTAPAIRKALIQKLQTEQAAYQGSTPYTIIDLGCASGSFACDLARAFPSAKIIAIDISWSAILITNIKKRLLGLSNLSVIKQDFMTLDISAANAILFYLTIYQMEELGKKLKAEATAGTFISSNRFQLGADWKPTETLEVKTLSPVEKNVYLYRA